MIDVSEVIWRWRCRVSGASEKKASDFSPSSPKLTLTEDSKDPTAGTKDTVNGVEPIVKILYEARNGTKTSPNWVDYPPKQVSKSVSKAHDRAAIKVYKTKDHSKPVLSGCFALKYHQVEIQSPVLVAALKNIVQKEDVYLEPTDVAKFEEPFRVLYFCSDEIAALSKTAEKNSVRKSHVELLIRVMDDILGETRLRVRRLQEHGLISFDLAWAYFPKDSFVYSWEFNCGALAKVVNTVYNADDRGDFLRISCKLLAFDGANFVWQDHLLEVRDFAGNKPITDLRHYPLSFHANPEGVKAALATRARKVLDLQGLSYCTYQGVALNGELRQIRHNVDGRILIDVPGYSKHCQNLGSERLEDPQYLKKRVLPGESKTETELSVNGATSEETQVENTSLTPSRFISEEAQAKNKKGMLAVGQDLAFMSPLIQGYALRNKEWMNFYVEDICPVEWNDSAYDHLVYDEQQKDLVLSFVENHRGSQGASDDVIKGKGQGLNILLSGPPGTGKTLTAEAVADRCRRPLFYLQAEDLGLAASDLGKNLKKVFGLATEWNAVILLDEADVFMAHRSPSDIVRNELVSIFLRELEYYRGVIFLTTNLYDAVDGAFRSRINLHLLFNPLTPEARLSVWEKFLERATANADDKSVLDSLDKEELKELARWNLNGREIKNAVKMVKSWCDYKGYEMTRSRVESGIKVSAPHVSKRDNEYTPELYE